MDGTIDQRRYTPVTYWVDKGSGDVMLQQSGHYICVDNVPALLELLRTAKRDVAAA